MGRHYSLQKKVSKKKSVILYGIKCFVASVLKNKSMTKTILLLFCTFFLFEISFAQQRTITGRLTDSNGEGLPGVSIVIKGTADGTITDIDGNYSITAPVGDTLVFQFVGMETKEIVVGSEQSKSKGSNEPRKQYPIATSIFSDSVYQKTKGVGILTSKTSTYRSEVTPQVSSILKIRKTGANYRIRTENDPYKRTGFSLQYTTQTGMEVVSQLPKIQNQYAQGRPTDGAFLWRGADQNEPFSWVPLIRTLEFDGSIYPFDKNGKLVVAGNGSGRAATSYKSNDFFKTGFNTRHEAILTLPGFGKSDWTFDLEKKYKTGIIPNSQYDRNSVGLDMRNLRLSNHFTANSTIRFNNSSAFLPSHGANLSSIMAAVLTTPPTFDNANGFSRKDALKTDQSYQLVDGTPRSFASGFANNPYGLVSNSEDKDVYNRLLTGVSLFYENRNNPMHHFKSSLISNFDQQWNQSRFGLGNGYHGTESGRMTHRRSNESRINVISSTAYSYILNYDLNWTSGIQYHFTQDSKTLSRKDGFGVSTENIGNLNMANTIQRLDSSRDRSIHEIELRSKLIYKRFTLRLGNRTYSSSTANSTFLLLPSAGISGKFYAGNLNFRPYVSVAQSISEASLIYNNWSYASTLLNGSDLNYFYESNELFASSLNPEKATNLETGLEINVYHFSLDANYFNNLTENFIAPIANNSIFQLKNIADVRNEGVSVTLSYNTSYWRHFRFSAKVYWSTYTSTAENVDGSEGIVPIAGFNGAYVGIDQNKSIGTIYGSSFLRSETGEMVIGADGYPLVDTDIKALGDNVPDWILGFQSEIWWKFFTLKYVFDFKKGGDIWNGTRAALDYLGQSEHSAKHRNTANYIFEGVDAQGNVNTIPVDFSNPADDIKNNRWVRYGMEGVTEAYIEDATSLRLTELSFGYSSSIRNQWVKGIHFSIILHNLFQITPYSGVDPDSDLFGYQTGAGLDAIQSAISKKLFT